MGWLKKGLAGAKKLAGYVGTAQQVYSTLRPAKPPKAAYSSVYPVPPPSLAQGSRVTRFPLGIHTISPQTKTIAGFALLAVIGFIGLRKFKVV